MGEVVYEDEDVIVTVGSGGSGRRPVVVKMSEDELHAVDKAARITGMTRSEFIRKAALEKAKRILEVIKANP